ncbi:hypothetical protein RJ641_033796, partial [Dillenia turbinata]
MHFFGVSEMSPSPTVPTISENGTHMLYLLNRNGWSYHLTLRTLSTQQDHKVMFGLLFPLRSSTAKMDPTSMEKGNIGVPSVTGQQGAFFTIISVTHPKSGSLLDCLKYNLYVEYVIQESSLFSRNSN